MISEQMQQLVKGSSVIRAMFEEGKIMAKKYGAENVYDFSLGNPSVEPPAEVKRAMIDVLENEQPGYVHGYMSNSGYEEVRAAIATHLNTQFDTHFHKENIVMTVGAAGGLNVALKTLLNPGDEVIVFAPYFGEYNNYVANYGGKVVVISPDTATFMPKLDELEKKITAKTKAVIINTPNNPTGVVYSEKVLQNLAKVLEDKQTEFGTDIYLISDEPYRELVYGGVEVPYVTKYYANTIVGYSYSKSLSLPGERIGYLVLPDEMADAEDVIGAANVATRILGFVNAPSLIQKAVARCLAEKTDVTFYDENRSRLYEGLAKLGFTCIKPEGAFYLWVKSPVENEEEFVNEGKKFTLLMVKGSAFGCPGFVRLAYCVSHETVEHSLPAFAKLAAVYGLEK